MAKDNSGSAGSNLMNKKIKIRAAAVLLLALAGVGYLLLSSQFSRSPSQSTDDPDKQVPVGENILGNWKTFNYSSQSFSFRYPSDRIAIEQEDGSVYLTSQEAEEIMEVATGEVTDQIYFFPREEESSVAQILGLAEPVSFSEEYFSSEEVKNHLNSYVGKLDIGGRNAFQIVHSEYSDVMYTLIPNPDGSVFVIEQGLGYPSENQEYAATELYNTIISTLHFTDI